MKMYIITEHRNFKTFLQENYAIALDSSYLLNKKLLNMELYMTLLVLIVPMELAYIIHT